MTVYVDPQMSCQPKGRYRWDTVSHMFADSVEELKAFAVSIGMRVEWFQNRPDLPHFDLNPGRYKAAVKAGAAQVNHRFMVEHMWENRRVQKEAQAKQGTKAANPKGP